MNIIYIWSTIFKIVNPSYFDTLLKFSNDYKSFIFAAYCKNCYLIIFKTTLSLIYIYLSGNAACTIFRQENHTKTCSLVTANDPETGAVIKLKHKA